MKPCDNIEPESLSLADTLARALLEHSQKKGPRGFDLTVRTLLGQEPPTLDAVVTAAVRLQRLVQDTWEEDTKAACKRRKLYHRAWLRGLIVGAVERGLFAPEIARGIALAMVPVAYEEAIPLPVFAYSLGYSFGQAWATLKNSGQDRLEWLSALVAGAAQAEAILREGARVHQVDLDPDLVPPQEFAMENVQPGFQLGAVAGLFG